jgi:hypothetical protein
MDMELDRYAQRLRMLHSDLADRVQAGEITDMQANELANDIADRWVRDGVFN